MHHAHTISIMPVEPITSSGAEDALIGPVSASSPSSSSDLVTHVAEQEQQLVSHQPAAAFPSSSSSSSIIVQKQQQQQIVPSHQPAVASSFISSPSSPTSALVVPTAALAARADSPGKNCQRPNASHWDKRAREAARKKDLARWQRVRAAAIEQKRFGMDVCVEEAQ